MQHSTGSSLCLVLLFLSLMNHGASSPDFAPSSGSLIETSDLLDFQGRSEEEISKRDCTYQTNCPDGCTFHGTCISKVCHCFEGWTGDRCNITTCPDTPCGPHSRCLANGTCLCDPGYGGPNCTDLICMPHTKGSCCDHYGNCLCNGTRCPDGVGVDLVVVKELVNPFVKTVNFGQCHCAVNESCTSPGTRRLLTFGTYLRNIGKVDLFFGRPGAFVDEQFVYHQCHDHAHFHDTAGFELRSNDTNQVVVGMKHGFCLVDSFRTANSQAKTAPVYDCTNQGLQTMWNDAYPSNLDCQWLDITDVEPGSYLLVMEVNPVRKIWETNYDNNRVVINVQIPPVSTPPPPSTASPSTTDSKTTSGPNSPPTGNHIGETKDKDSSSSGGSLYGPLWTISLIAAVFSLLSLL